MTGKNLVGFHEITLTFSLLRNLSLFSERLIEINLMFLYFRTGTQIRASNFSCCNMSYTAAN